MNSLSAAAQHFIKLVQTALMGRKHHLMWQHLHPVMQHSLAYLAYCLGLQLSLDSIALIQDYIGARVEFPSL